MVTKRHTRFVATAAAKMLPIGGTAKVLPIGGTMGPSYGEYRGRGMSYEELRYRSDCPHCAAVGS